MRQVNLNRMGIGLISGILATGSALLCGQEPMVGSGLYGTVQLVNSDQAVLEVQEPRSDLPCTVTPVKPLLGFDLRLHTGYEVSVPLRSLVGPENLLTIVFRVTPEDSKEDPAYFSHRFRVPPIEEDAKGDAYLQGIFDVGEGKYHVDWLMRDRTERVCSFYWDVDAELAEKDKDVDVTLAPGAIAATQAEPFKDEPPVARAQDKPLLNVKVLINFAPQNSSSAVLQPLDTNALVAILRTISREPRIGKFSIIAFNLQEQRVVYRQENADRIDFPALGEALESLNLGTVDLQRLSQKHGDTQFLTELVQRESSGDSLPDALVFAGPKAMLDENISPDVLKQLGSLSYPVFYMNYILQPSSNPWRDTIGNAVKLLKGTEFTISRPRDLWFAVSDMVSRILNFRSERRTVAAPTQ